MWYIIITILVVWIIGGPIILLIDFFKWRLIFHSHETEFTVYDLLMSMLFGGFVLVLAARDEYKKQHPKKVKPLFVDKVLFRYNSIKLPDGT